DYARKIVVHSTPPGWIVLYLEPPLATSLACRVVVCLLSACLYRRAWLATTSTVRSAWLRSLGRSYFVPCPRRFLPSLLGAWRHCFDTSWRTIAGKNLGCRVVDRRHPVGADVYLGLG